ncbi:MAG: hypothetical protein KF689_08845 [Gemmatimonadaceae bacterium]|nr:hypothetical protein [Gemmatimonadaceae bacterium]MCW5826297.1 hypothetical protein [Gemmatimonadaceae bacterium]
MPRPLSVPLALILILAATPPLFAQVRRPPPEERERAAARQAALAAGTFVAERIDREPLPQTDEVVDDEGTTYIIEFDRLVLSLRDDRRFRASVRYRRTLYSADPRGRSRRIPLQTMTVTGTYAVIDSEILFNPDPSEETRGLRMLAGRVVGPREISLPFQYRNGTRQRDRTLVMRRDDNIL